MRVPLKQRWQVGVVAGVLSTAVFLQPAWGPIAWSADDDCAFRYFAARTQWEQSPDEQKGLIQDYIRNQFASLAKKEDPTAFRFLREDVRPTNALVKAVVDPQEGLLAKMMMIDGAKHTLDVGTYIFSRDEVGYALLARVKKAIQRGVDVRVLIDSGGSPHPTHAELKALRDVPRGDVLDENGKFLRKSTVEVRMFNPFSNVRNAAEYYFETLANLLRSPEDKVRVPHLKRNHRMHSKMLIADADYPNAVAIIGGRNLDAKYYAYPTLSPKTYNDAELLVKNDPNDPRKTIGSTYGTEYQKLFHHWGNKELSRLLLGENDFRLGRELGRMDRAEASMFKNGGEYEKKLQQMVQDDYLNSDFESGRFLMVSEIENVLRSHALLDPEIAYRGVKNKNLASIIQQSRKTISKAKKDITIVSPYLYLTDEEFKWLRNWLGEDSSRRLRIISNSVATGDNMPAQAMIDKMIAPRLLTSDEFAPVRKQIEVHEFGKLDSVAYGGTQYYGKIHAKFWVIDGGTPDEAFLVGSQNGDMRGRDLNAEVAGVVKGARKATQAYMDLADSLARRSTAWGSEEWQAIRARKENSLKLRLESAMEHVIELFVPMI